MSQKKISGYTIFLDKLLGKGSYGAVIKFINFRYTKESEIKLINMWQSKSFKRNQVNIL